MVKPKDAKKDKGQGRKDGGKEDGAEVALNKLVVYAASKDCAIRELIHGQSRAKFETIGFMYSQLCMLAGGKAFFAGVSNPGGDTGAVHVLNYSH